MGKVVGHGVEMAGEIVGGAGQLLGVSRGSKKGKQKETEEVDDTVFYNNPINKSLVAIKNKLDQ